MLNGIEVHHIHRLAHIKIKIGHKYRHNFSITITVSFLVKKSDYGATLIYCSQMYIFLHPSINFCMP
jgi:hypothetical protein